MPRGFVVFYFSRRICPARLMLQDLCAGSSTGLCICLGIRWSACHGSRGSVPLPQIQQTSAVSRTCLAALRYEVL